MSKPVSKHTFPPMQSGAQCRFSGASYCGQIMGIGSLASRFAVGSLNAGSELDGGSKSPCRYSSCHSGLLLTAHGVSEAIVRPSVPGIRRHILSM